MAQTLSLMEFLHALLTEPGLRGDFGDDPQGTLAAHGLADLTPADVHDALVLVQDTQTVDYSLDAATAPSPPPPAGDGHEAAVEYLARYLADPDQHHDAAPLDGFGAGDGSAYGAGSEIPAGIPTGIPTEIPAGIHAGDGGWGDGSEPGYAAYPADAQAGHEPVEPDGFGHLDGFDEITGFADLAVDVPDGHDTDPWLPDGA